MQCWTIPRVAWGCGTESRLLLSRRILQDFFWKLKDAALIFYQNLSIIPLIELFCPNQYPAVVACLEQGGTGTMDQGLDRCNRPWP